MPQRSGITFDVGGAEDGWRLDRAVQAGLASTLDSPPSRADARALIEGGAVRVNGRRCDRSSARVRAGDRVEASFDPEALGASAEGRAARVELPPAAIAYEDDAMLVVDKPAGLPSHATRDPARDHLLAAVTRSLEARDDHAPLELRVVHRLDADTSGLVILGKTAEATRALSAAFASRDVEKIYVAVVDTRDAVLPDSWTVGDHLAWNKRERRTRRVRSGGDPAHTDFRVLRRSGARALVEARPRTGRTHQIRVHLLESRAPIVGDRLYGSEESAPRLLLHALRLELPHPTTRERLMVESALPDALDRAL